MKFSVWPFRLATQESLTQLTIGTLLDVRFWYFGKFASRADREPLRASHGLKLHENCSAIGAVARLSGRARGEKAVTKHDGPP